MGPKLPSAGAHKYDRLIRIASKYRWQLGAGDVGCAALELCAWAQLGSRGPGRHTQHMETRPKRRRQAAQAQVREPLSWVKGTSTCCLTEPMHTHACMQPPAAHHRCAMAQPPVSLEDVWLGECTCLGGTSVVNLQCGAGEASHHTVHLQGHPCDDAKVTPNYNFAPEIMTGAFGSVCNWRSLKCLLVGCATAIAAYGPAAQCLPSAPHSGLRPPFRCCCADQSQASKVHKSDADAVQVSEAASLIAAAAAEAPTRPGLSSAAAAAAKDKANQLIAELYNGLGLAEAVPGAFGGEGQNGRPKGKDKTKGKYARGVRA